MVYGQIAAAVVLTALVIAALSLVIYTFLTGISPMPTGPKVAPVLKQAVTMLYPATEPPPRTAFELGCGWGSLLLPLTSLLPHTEWHAWERSPVPYWVTRLRLAIGRGKTGPVRCQREDFFKADLSEADLVVCYLYPGAMTRLSQKLAREAKPTCWIVSHTFRLPGRTPDREITCNDLYHTPIYCYRGGGIHQQSDDPSHSGAASHSQTVS